MSPELIAQVSANDGDVQQLLTRVLPWVAALVLVLVVLVGAIGYYRRRWRRAREVVSPLWTLQDLRQMYARGDLAKEEYEHLKARLLGEYGLTGKVSGNATDGQTGATGDDDGQ